MMPKSKVPMDLVPAKQTAAQAWLHVASTPGGLSALAARCASDHVAHLQQLGYPPQAKPHETADVHRALALQLETIALLRKALDLATEDGVSILLHEMSQQDEQNFDLLEAAANELRETGEVS